MKKSYYLLSVLLLFSLGVFAQTPEKLNYQAIIRNSSDMIVANQSIGIQISVLQGSNSGSAVYVETQNPTTNVNGLITIQIGSGSVVSGDFSTINWSTNLFFIKTEIDITGGTSYTITGTNQLLSVPYALHAKTAETFTGSITETDPSFTSSDAFNITTADITKLSNLSGTNTGDQDISGIVTNTSDITVLETEQITQNTAIALNTAKTGITAAQAAEITTNTTKTGISAAQVTAISDNTSDIATLETEQDTQDTAIALNTAKTGITSAQSAEIDANTLKTGISAAQVTAISDNTSDIATLETEQDTQDTAIALNTAKTGITSAQAAEIDANTLKTGISAAQVTAISDNTSDIATLETEQDTQDTAIALNSAKTGITSSQAAEIDANTLKTGISVAQTTAISDNTSDIAALETEQDTQDTAIALNSAKTGITSAQAAEIDANTLKTGISAAQATAISDNTSDIATLETEQGTQDAAIALNTAKVTNATHTGDVTGNIALTISDDAVTIAKIGTAGASDANKSLTTDASGNPQWSINTVATTSGDIKHGIQAADHSGWVLLDGRSLTTLTTSQQTQATTLGLSGNLPDATDAYLSQNGTTLGSISNDNLKTIAQNNLPDVTLTGTTSTDGAHTHTFDDYHYIDNGQDNNYATEEGDDTGRRTTSNNETDSDGDHTHTLTTSSINGGVTQQQIDITPKTLSVNVFIYLGE